MASTLSLPPPRNTPAAPAAATKTLPSESQHRQEKRAPSYEERCTAAAHVAQLLPEERRRTKLFVPRALADFDDGGAFPEIHVAQYPRHMGNSNLAAGKRSNNNDATTRGLSSSGTSRALMNVEIDETGQVSYDAIVKGGTNADRIVYSRHEDMKGGDADLEDVALPTPDEEAAEAAKTQAALAALLNQKTAMDKQGSAIINAESSQNVEAKTQFVKYTPRPDAPGYNPAAANRIIQMVPAQVDPMMPPKHKHFKAPRGPAEDPVPVLHAPPAKLTKEEKAAWNIPASISNWKNSRGFTIPLDKRLAADGRGLRDHTINPNFANLSESLYVAERQARQEVRLRATVQKKLALQEKEQREEELRQLANQARMQRGGMATTTNNNDDDDDDDDGPSESGAEDVTPRDESEDQVAARQREALRVERKRQREREMRLENSMEFKKKKLDEERDISEKIALGAHTGTGGLGGDVDSRLYNQTAGMDSGFSNEDDYNVYSKPLFDRPAVGASIYRPTRGETDLNADEQYDRLKTGATSRFQPDKGFAGAEGNNAGPRSAPVQFQRGEGTK